MSKFLLAMPILKPKHFNFLVFGIGLPFINEVKQSFHVLSSVVKITAFVESAFVRTKIVELVLNKPSDFFSGFHLCNV